MKWIMISFLMFGAVFADNSSVERPQTHFYKDNSNQLQNIEESMSILVGDVSLLHDLLEEAKNTNLHLQRTTEALLLAVKSIERSNASLQGIVSLQERRWNDSSVKRP